MYLILKREIIKWLGVLALEGRKGEFVKSQETRETAGWCRYCFKGEDRRDQPGLVTLGFTFLQTTCSIEMLVGNNYKLIQ